MASSPPTAEVYNTTQFEELYKGSLSPAMENLALASRFLLRLFQQHKIPSAFLGGWAVYLRGGPRMTQDVDIAVATSMSRLKTVLLGEERLCFPENHGQTCIQIFVHTGMPWDQGSANPYTVRADAIIQGNLGTPANLTDGITEIVPVPAGTHIQQAPVLEIVYQFNAKLHAYANRRSDTDRDFEDLRLHTIMPPPLHSRRPRPQDFDRQRWDRLRKLPRTAKTAFLFAVYDDDGPKLRELVAARTPTSTSATPYSALRSGLAADCDDETSGFSHPEISPLNAAIQADNSFLFQRLRQYARLGGDENSRKRYCSLLLKAASAG
ncbi:hypothetical protein NHJ13051_005569 [Beauveria bassiana]